MVSQGTSLQWKWVWVGVVVGALLTTVCVGLVFPVFHNPFIPALIGSLCSVITGIIVGYKSPGVTIREAAIAGLILMILSLLVLYVGFGVKLSFGFGLFTLALGFFLALLGSWVGEQLQGTLSKSESQTAMVQWPWIAVGVVIGFLLNNFAVFLLFALFRYGVPQILTSLGLSFLVTGIIIGYKSPGVTIKEAAFAGIALVIVNFLFIYLGFQTLLPIGHLVIGLIGGFLLSLLGGWIGEKLQSRAEQK